MRNALFHNKKRKTRSQSRVFRMRSSFSSYRGASRSEGDSLLVDHINNAIGDRLNERFRLRIFADFDVVVQDRIRGAAARLVAATERRRIERAMTDARFLPAVAEHIVRAKLAVFRLEARILDSPLRLKLEKRFRFVFREVARLAKIVRDHENAAVRVENFREPVRFLDGRSQADGAVIGENDDVGLVNVRQNGVGKFLTAGNRVLRDRNVAHVDVDFGKNALRNRFLRNPEGGGIGRMAMEDGTNFGALLHDRQVEEDFARALARAGDLIPFHVDDAKILGLHEPFADLRRGADDAILVDTIADIAVVRRRKAPIVQSATNIADFVLNLVQIEHMPFLLL